MHLFKVTFPTGNFRVWFYAIASALVTLTGIMSDAKADPRIDLGTVPAVAQQVAALHKASDGTVEQEGVASWYGRHWRGRKTASGARFDERRLTAASLALPLATRARVTNLQNGRSVDVLVNDRGPYAGDRVMDLSQKAALALGMTQSGLAQVVIRAQIGPSPIRG
jgi:rare lipoprotein A